MALQAVFYLSSSPTFAIHNHKEAKYDSSPRDKTLLGVSLSEHLKVYAVSPLVKFKECKKWNLVAAPIRAQTATKTPAISQAASEEKKTLRKGNVIITGASSGLGLATAKALAETGEWHIIMACRNFLKAEKAAKFAAIGKENYTVIHLDLASLDSVRQFIENFRNSNIPLDALVCNAAVYLPTAKQPSFTAEGFELSVGTNHLGHFLLSRLLLEDLKKSDHPSKRLIIVGSITEKS